MFDIVQESASLEQGGDALEFGKKQAGVDRYGVLIEWTQNSDSEQKNCCGIFNQGSDDFLVDFLLAVQFRLMTHCWGCGSDCNLVERSSGNDSFIAR